MSEGRLPADTPPMVINGTTFWPAESIRNAGPRCLAPPAPSQQHNEVFCADGRYLFVFPRFPHIVSGSRCRSVCPRHGVAPLSSTVMHRKKCFHLSSSSLACRGHHLPAQGARDASRTDNRQRGEPSLTAALGHAENRFAMNARGTPSLVITVPVDPIGAAESFDQHSDAPAEG